MKPLLVAAPLFLIHCAAIAPTATADVDKPADVDESVPVSPEETVALPETVSEEPSLDELDGATDSDASEEPETSETEVEDSGEAENEDSSETGPDSPSFATEEGRAEEEPDSPEDAATETPTEAEEDVAPPATTESTPPIEEQEDGGFAAWMAAFKLRAAEAGISRETIDALDAISPIPRVIELDRRQPERRFTFQQYMARVVPESRVEEGRRRYAEHKEILEKIGGEYGVQPRFLVALWGIETDYGRNTGGFRVLDSLATLAHEGRRAAFFETELINALRIIDAGHITPDRMIGSWAGALGQCQFMPSSFLSYAVDFTGDGKRDIWGVLPDVFASSANYLSRHGWQSGQTWGRSVRLPNDFDRSMLGLDTQKPLAEWQSLGVRRAGGGDLPSADFQASLVQPGGASGPTYLVYENYRTIMRWNRSHYFATAVGTLADRIGAP